MVVVKIYGHTHLFINSTTRIQGCCLSAVEQNFCYRIPNRFYNFINTTYKANSKLNIAANAEKKTAIICIANSMSRALSKKNSMSRENCVQNNVISKISSSQLNKVMKVILVISK